MDRKRKRNSRANEPDWTATRCQRLLRPIASRIAPLRKLAYITDAQRPDKETTNSKTGLCAGSSCGNTNNLSNDPAWLHRQDNSSKVRKYTSKARAPKRDESSRQQPQSNVVILPTPFRARVLRRNTPGRTPSKWHDDDKASPCVNASDRVPKRLKKDPFSFAPIAMQSAELHDRQAFEKVFELHQGVTDGFSLLLERTQLSQEDHQSSENGRRGARSLFSACLRRVPEYVQAEEDWRRSVDPDDETDVCAEVYEELEELGSSFHGWTPLREVVRAHGIKLVDDIIREKLVSLNTRAQLANMPLSQGGRVDSERLALTFASSLPLKRPLNNTSPLFIGCLTSMADVKLFNPQSSYTQTRFRILGSLLSSKKLHSSWIATKDMSEAVSQAVRILASSGTRNSDHVIAFLQQIMIQALDMEEANEGRKLLEAIGGNAISKPVSISSSLLSTFRKTTDSLLTVLTAMAIISSKQESCQGRVSSQTAIDCIQRIVTLVISRSVETSGQHCSQSFSTARFKSRLITSALMITSARGETLQGHATLSTKDLIALMLKMSDSRVEAMQEASSFICDLALCCGQSLSFDAQDVLEDLVCNLMTSAEAGTAKERICLQQLALETALSFVTTTSSRKSRTFAEKLERTLQVHGSLPPKESRLTSASQHGNFRWEEGLCEWIASTPFPAHKERPAVVKPTRGPKSPSASPTQKSKSFGSPLGVQSHPLDKSDNDINDSGYLSMHETPHPTSRRVSALVFSSPDELNDEPRDKPLKVISGQLESASLPKSPSRMPVKRMVIPSPTLRASQKMSVPNVSATDSSSHTAWRKQRLLQKYGPAERREPKRKTERRSETKMLRATSAEITQQPRGQNARVSTREISEPRLLFAQLESDIPSGSVIEAVSGTPTTKVVNMDEDELAMSCKKPLSRPSLGRSSKSGVLEASSQKPGSVREAKKRAARVTSQPDSDDELG